MTWLRRLSGFAVGLMALTSLLLSAVPHRHAGTHPCSICALPPIDRRVKVGGLQATRYSRFGSGPPALLSIARIPAKSPGVAEEVRPPHAIKRKGGVTRWAETTSRGGRLRPPPRAPPHA